MGRDGLRMGRDRASILHTSFLYNKYTNTVLLHNIHSQNYVDVSIFRQKIYNIHLQNYTYIFIWQNIEHIKGDPTPIIIPYDPNNHNTSHTTHNYYRAPRVNWERTTRHIYSRRNLTPISFTANRIDAHSSHTSCGELSIST